jgi:hypothetical protein
MDEQAAYTLHYFPFSLYSLIARLGLVLAETLDPETAPRVEIKLVNLHREENLSEAYLTQVNSKGQVSMNDFETPTCMLRADSECFHLYLLGSFTYVNVTTLIADG